jgi:hypothetical protein
MARPLEPSKEEGRWTAKVWDFPAHGGSKAYHGVVVESDDFTHDVHLEIRGDFRDEREKLEYARLLARRLNLATEIELSQAPFKLATEEEARGSWKSCRKEIAKWLARAASARGTRGSGSGSRRSPKRRARSPKS